MSKEDPAIGSSARTVLVEAIGREIDTEKESWPNTSASVRADMIGWKLECSTNLVRACRRLKELRPTRMSEVMAPPHPGVSVRRSLLGLQYKEWRDNSLEDLAARFNCSRDYVWQMKREIIIRALCGDHQSAPESQVAHDFRTDVEHIRNYKDQIRRERVRKEGSNMNTVKLFKDGDTMAIETTCVDETVFIQRVSAVLGELADAGAHINDWDFQLNIWLPQIVDICCKYRGYKNTIRTETVYTAGHFRAGGESIEAEINAKGEIKNHVPPLSAEEWEEAINSQRDKEKEESQDELESSE